MGGVVAAAPPLLTSPPRRLAVVGAGAAGLSAARVLHAAGHEVTVFDKGRKPGGRMALRETALGAFDHGAPCLRGHAPAQVAPWQTLAIAGHLADWPEQQAGSLTAVPAMQQLAQLGAKGLDVRLAQHVEQITPAAAGWQLLLPGAATPFMFDAVVITVPQPQLQPLLPATGLPPSLAQIDYDPCWTLLWTPTATTLPHMPYAEAIEHGVLRTLIREDLKPGRSGPPRYVIHARADWSRQWLERTSDEAASALQAEAAAWLGIASDAHYLAAHRWRYAEVRQALGAAQCTLAPGLHYASDGCLGEGIAGAIESGQAAANTLLSNFEVAAA